MTLEDIMRVVGNIYWVIRWIYDSALFLQFQSFLYTPAKVD